MKSNIKQALAVIFACLIIAAAPLLGVFLAAGVLSLIAPTFLFFVTLTTLGMLAFAKAVILIQIATAAILALVFIGLKKLFRKLSESKKIELADGSKMAL